MPNQLAICIPTQEQWERKKTYCKIDNISKGLIVDYKNVRKGFTQAKDIEDKSSIIFFEIFIIALAIGVKTESWWWGGGILFFLAILINFKKIAYIFSFVLSVFWGMIGYAIGSLFESMGAMVVLGVLGFMISLGTHLSGIEEMEDLKP